MSQILLFMVSAEPRFSSSAEGSRMLRGRERSSKDRLMCWRPARWQPRVLSRRKHVVSQGFERPACRPKGLELGSKSLSAPKIGISLTQMKADRLEFNHSPHSPCATIAIQRQTKPGMDFSNGTNSGSEEKEEAGDQSSCSSKRGRRAWLINRDSRYGRLGPPKPAALSRPKWFRPCSERRRVRPRLPISSMYL